MQPSARVKDNALRAGRIPELTIRAGALICRATFAVSIIALPAYAQSPLTVSAAMQLAAQNAPSVDPGTLIAFAYHESRLHPWAIHDNTSTRTYLPPSLAEAVAVTSALLDKGHSLDLGVMQVNSANLQRLGLPMTSAFDPGLSMRAGAIILAAAYQQCLFGRPSPSQQERQAALRCAASVYNTGNKQAGIANGYQAKVWFAAAHLVPAIQIAGSDASQAQPEDTATPQPRRPPPGLEDALHATPPVPDDSEMTGDSLPKPTQKAD